MSRDYKYMKEDKYLTECASCGSVAPLSNFPVGNCNKVEDRYICELCASSFIGNATKYPTQYENVSLYQSIAQVGNVILDILTGRRDKDGTE